MAHGNRGFPDKSGRRELFWEVLDKAVATRHVDTASREFGPGRADDAWEPDRAPPKSGA